MVTGTKLSQFAFSPSNFTTTDYAVCVREVGGTNTDLLFSQAQLQAGIGGSSTPGAPRYAIQFNNPLGTFAGDANLSWYPSGTTSPGGDAYGGAANLLHASIGNFANIDLVFFAPNDPTGPFATPLLTPLAICENNHGDLSTVPSGEITSIAVYPGVRHTGTNPLNFYLGVDLEPTINTDSTGPITNFSGLQLFGSNMGTGNITYGFGGAFTYSDSGASGTTTHAMGGQFSVNPGGSRTFTNAVGGFFGSPDSNDLFGSPTISLLAGGYFKAFTKAGGWGGTIANAYGNYIEDWSGLGAAGVNWNLYSKGASSFNQFDGTINIGAASGVHTGVLEFTGKTSGVVSLSVADAAGTWTMKLPITAGTANYFLQTDGSGNTTWAAGGSGTLAIGSSIGSGTDGGKVLYDDSGTTLQEAAHFTISSGQPNVPAGFAYLYDGSPVITAQIAQMNFFDGGAGNLTNSGSSNNGTGIGALVGLTTGSNNSAVGPSAMAGNKTGGNNVALGPQALQSDQTPGNCLVVGLQAMALGQGAANCVVVGNGNLINYSSPSAIVAIGPNNIGSGTVTGQDCLAIGGSNLTNLTSGTDLIAIGHNNMAAATSASDCICIGHVGMSALSSGTRMIGIGLSVLNTATSDGYHIGIGHHALINCNIGGTSNGNIAIGAFAGRNVGNGGASGDGNIFIGGSSSVGGCGDAIFTGSGNAYFGLVTGGGDVSNNIAFADGAGSERMRYNGGWLMGAATGGGQGAGTLNVTTGIFLNGTGYTNPDYALEHYFDHSITKFAANPGASSYQGLTPLADLEGYMHANYRLPGMNRVRDRPVDIFERADIALEKTEELALYICQLHKRIADLEGARHG